MGYIEFSVFNEETIGYFECFQERVIRWLSTVHIGSLIDIQFNDNGINLRNLCGENLRILGYNPDSVYKLIECKTDSGDDSEWYRAKERCKEEFDYIDERLTGYEYSNREVFDIYSRAKSYSVDSVPAWCVSDIKLSDRNNGSLYTVSIQVSAQTQRYYDDYEEVKHKIEDRLTDIYFTLENNIEIPRSISDRKKQEIIAKMIVALKGKCQFQEVDDLSLRKEHIITSKYLGDEKRRINHPAEITPEWDIRDVTYEFPEEESWADVMKAMGAFSADPEDYERIIRICNENIEKTIRFMREDTAFKKDIIDPIKITYGIRDDSELLRTAAALLKHMVIAHELGHMVFRQIKNDRTINENESLANWFSCLVSNDFGRKMVSALVPYQSEEYKDFIDIPDLYRIKRKPYDVYCQAIESLLRDW